MSIDFLGWVAGYRFCSFRRDVIVLICSAKFPFQIQNQPIQGLALFESRGQC